MKISDMTPTQMPSAFNADDAMIIFKPEGVIVLLPEKFKEVPQDGLPKYILMAMATTYALSDNMLHDYILEHFQKEMKKGLTFLTEGLITKLIIS